MRLVILCREFLKPGFQAVLKKVVDRESRVSYSLWVAQAIAGIERLVFLGFVPDGLDRVTDLDRSLTQIRGVF